MNQHTAKFATVSSVSICVALALGGFSSCAKKSFEEDTKQLEIKQRVLMNVGGTTHVQAAAPEGDHL